MIVNGIASCLTPIVSYSYLVVSLFPCSYHKLMVVKYRNKWEKTQEAKQRSAVEQRPVCKLERAMDVDLFLEIQGKWADGQPSPPSNIAQKCSAMLHLRRMERGGTNRLPRPLAAHAPA